MIQIKDKQLLKEINDGIAEQRDIVHYLLKNYTVYDIAEALAEVIATNPNGDSRITLTADEFFAHFKIRGYKPDGTLERRGSKGLSADNAVADLFTKIKPNSSL